MKIDRKKFFMCGILAAGIFLAGCAQGVAEEKTVTYYYTEGEKAVLVEAYDVALGYYAQALELIETDSKEVDMELSAGIVYFNIGYCYEQSGKYEKALQAYLQSSTYDASAVLAKTALGSVYFDLKKYDKSKKYFEQALDLDEKAYEAYVNLSAIYALEKDTPMALSLLNQAIEVDSSRPDAYLNRGYIFASLGEEALMKKDIKALKEMNFSALDVYIKIFNDTLQEDHQ